MRQLVRSVTIIIAVLLLSVWSIVPPEKKLRLGRDLGGGTSLVYSVQTGSDDRDLIPKMIAVLKERVDPQGLSEVQFVQRGRDRIEITMPAPSESVKRLKAKLEEELAKLNATEIDASQFERLMRMEAGEREAEIKRLTGSDQVRADQIRAAAEKFKAKGETRLQVAGPESDVKAAQAEMKAAKDAGADKAVLDQLQAKLDVLEAKLTDLVAKAADADAAYDAARDLARGSRLTSLEMRRAISLSKASQSLRDETTGKTERLPSPRESTVQKLKDKHPEAAAQIDAIVKAADAYAAERRGLDDPADLKRLIANAGVLALRITVESSGDGAHPEEARLRQELREHGPKAVRSTDARWYKINRIENWYESAQELAQLQQSPAAFFQVAKGGYVVEAYNGEYFMLCWDTPLNRLTRADGEWGVAGAFIGPDQRGLNAIKFQMNAQGGKKLGDLSGRHVGKKMAVLLDDEVYTAPRLQSQISSSAEITGNFSGPELDYIVRVLSAGSLQAKLSPEPLSQSTLGPALGKDNLDRGFLTGIIAFSVVAVFMVVYYFMSGAIGVVALAINFVLVLAVMAVNKAAFTLPGIAGIVLTFGQAIDANVLVYERMREEFLRGADLRTAVRLGFSRAYSSIVDGNVSNLLICIVLYYFGTPEIRGFAITLGIGVVTTLFTGVYVSRVIFTIFVDHLGWKHASQLPMKVPLVQRLLTPHVDWMKWRWVLLGGLTVFLVISGIIWAQRGEKLLDTEFLGGTQVEIKFKAGPDGKPLTQTRAQVQARVEKLGSEAPVGSPLRALTESEVLAMDQQADGVTSDHFKITMVNRSGVETNDSSVLNALTVAFEDLIESRPALEFLQRDELDWKKAPVYKIFSNKLGDDIQLRSPGAPKTDFADEVGRFNGGVAIVLEGLKPTATKASIVARLEQIRQQSDYSETMGRVRDVLVLEGTDAAVKTAVVLVRDEGLNSFDNEAKWGDEVAAREWRMTVDAMSRPSQLARVETFSPTIAKTFKAQAVVSVVMSMLLLTIYVWVRFGAGRWAIAATLPLFADVVGIVGLIAIAQMLYENPSTNGFAVAAGLLPFKIDLNQIAALLTITGYSLNDKIIILDRIRENKGKLPYASYHVINDSINQTLSRTIITSGTTLFSTVVLYIYGGQAIRGFAYAFTLGVIIGTYTSIVSSPLVWSRGSDKAEAEKKARAAAEKAGTTLNGEAGTKLAGSTSPGRGADSEARPRA